MIYLDFETYSATDIAAGAYKYCSDPNAAIICMAYKIDEGPVQVWDPSYGVPDDLLAALADGDTICAHNAGFDYLVWNLIGTQQLPANTLARWVDSQALANRYTLPGGLAAAGEILGLEKQKQKNGKALIKKICTPTRAGKRPVAGVDFSHSDLVEFVEYCKADVAAMYELVNTLPASRLSADEQYYWEITQRMNFHGLPVDITEITRILEYIKGYAEEMTRRVPELTDNAVQKVTQLARMRVWMTQRGVPVKDLQALTVTNLLASEIPDDVRELLVLRQTIGRSSTAKYLKLKNMEHAGYVHGNLQYYGTSTGRWAGRGFQLHNLPRASVPDPEEYIRKFVNFEPVDDPVNVAKALIRPMIKAKDNELLMVSDYSSIENRLLSFVSGDDVALKRFEKGADQYIDMASFLYGVDESEVTKAQRQIGKIIILGCGYQMGAKRFVETAKSWGVNLSLAEAKRAVDAYRNKYLLVQTMWRKLHNACIDAIKFPGEVFTYNDCAFRLVKCRSGNRWLVLGIPSGRNLFYADPYLTDGPYGAVPKHMGINPYTKKWDGLFISPGRITENVIQALARDVMAYGLRQVNESMINEVKLIGTVHDEAIAVIREDHHPDILDKYNKCLCTKDTWAKRLPLAAEGYIAKRYRK